MRILLDECVDRRLRRALPGHQIVTVQEAGWAGFDDGTRLRSAVGKFDAILTVDRNLAFQQPSSYHPLIVVVFEAKTNRLADLLPLAPRFLSLLPNLEPGTVTRIRS